MNKVVKKILYYLDVRFVSPVSVSSGDEGLTDSDVMRDYDGAPFIAGTSLAGAFRNYLQPLSPEENIFGYVNEDDGKISKIYISDLCFLGKVRIVSRDGIALSEKKTAVTGAKYDMEAIDSGACGCFTIELILREQDPEEQIIGQICQILYGIDQGEIRLGSKKTRGYGEMKLLAVRIKEFTSENIKEYASAYTSDRRALKNKKDECLKKAGIRKRVIQVEVPLQLRGGISIRQYAAKKGEPDFVHITANGLPVIPGTSFAGAIRKRMKEFILILMPETNKDDAECIIEQLFGYVHEKNAHQSSIVISESVIEGAVPLTSARTAVSRFEGAVRKGSLYTERSYVNGKLTLKISLSAKAAENWAVGLLLLAVKDMQRGYLPIGGQTSIGRGILQADGPILINGVEADEKQYFINFPVMKNGEGL